MKYFISPYSKKPSTSTLDKDQSHAMDNLNVIYRLNALHRSQSAPDNSSFLFTSLPEPEAITRTRNNTDTFLSSLEQSDLNESMLDMNSNITFKLGDSLDNKAKSDNFHCKADLQNNNLVMKGVLLGRNDSIPGEDSGFSSSGCLSEEKDDISVKSYDCSFDYDDKCDSSGIGRKFSISSYSRLRSNSVDSAASSDISDSAELSSKLSSSLPSAYLDYEKLLLPLDQSRCAHLSSDRAVAKSCFKIKKRKSQVSPHPVGDDLNNNRAHASSKNLQSCLRSAPFQFADAFQNHGLMSFFGCICYTLVLVFFLGFTALLWEIFKGFVSKKDLRELRDNLNESRRKREKITYYVSRR